MGFSLPELPIFWKPHESNFDGLKSKETYGTSGTFIRLRFFGDWGFSKRLVKDKNFVKKAYKQGVPMGQDLRKKSATAPTFAVWALKDPESANLDRIQIIKGWYKDGHPWEKVYDVVWSDNRKPNAKTGKLPPVGNTVDIKDASYTNDIGDNELSAVWTDLEFDPSQQPCTTRESLRSPHRVGRRSTPRPWVSIRRKMFPRPYRSLHGGHQSGTHRNRHW